MRLIMGHKGKSALEILGSPDDLKLRSCLTLFGQAASDLSRRVGLVDECRDDGATRDRRPGDGDLAAGLRRLRGRCKGFDADVLAYGEFSVRVVTKRALPWGGTNLEKRINYYFSLRIPICPQRIYKGRFGCASTTASAFAFLKGQQARARILPPVSYVARGKVLSETQCSRWS